MTKRLISLAIFGTVAALVCVSIVFFVHKALMPTDTELKQIDGLVQKAVAGRSQQCTIERLSRPDQVGMTGNVKDGYFTYKVRCDGTESTVRANWKIEGGHIDLTSVTPE